MDEKPSISFLQPLDINVTGVVTDEKNLQISTDEVAPILPEIDQKQEKENDQCRETEPENDPENDHETDQDHISNNKMAAPSAYYHHQPMMSPVKPSVKFGSLNSVTEITKTNKLSKVSVPSSPSTSSGEVSSLSRTDNLSNNNNKSVESSLEVEMKPGSASPQINELSEAPSSDFLSATAPGIFPPQVSSFHASLAALAANNNESNGNRVKLITEFLQQQLQQHQHQQQQHQSSLFPSQCLEHPDFNGVDCKTCELLEIQGRTKSPPPLSSQSLPQLQVPPHRSPCSNLAMSPSSSSVTSVGNAGATGAGAGAASSFTIGACSDHINGRPQGVDCAR